MAQEKRSTATKTKKDLRKNLPSKKQIEQYDRSDKERPNNRPVGLVTQETESENGAGVGHRDILQRIQEESEQQALPQQENVFAVAKRVRTRLHNLPDPTHPPLGWVSLLRTARMEIQTRDARPALVVF